MIDQMPGHPASTLSRRGALVLGSWSMAGALALVVSPACSAQRDPLAAGGSDNDDALLARIVSDAQPLIPRRERPYRLTRTLPIAGGRTIRIEAGTRILWTGPLNQANSPVAVFEATGDDCGLVAQGDGVAVVACATPSITVCAVAMRGRRGLVVTGIQAEDCQHVHIYAGVGDYAAVRTGTASNAGGNVARDVRITGGGARFATMPTTNGNGACMLAYVVGAHVADVQYENVTSGVQWWGGDAGLESFQNGARANERKCRDVLIERVAVHGALVGGVWGSMGRDVTVRDCSVEECRDVGYDAEGCDRITFERCAAHNAHNGCFATFALCDSIRFVDCRGSVDNRAYPLLRIYNVTQSNADNRSVVVQGGRFECRDPTGPGVMDTAMGPVRELTITSATLTNVRIDTAHFNMHRTRIAGNTLTFTVPLGTASAIRAGSSKGTPAEPGSVTVENNRIRYDAAGTPGPSTAIELHEDDFNSNASDQVTGNTITGPFATAIMLTSATANVGIVPAFTVARNRFEALEPQARLLGVRKKGAGPRPLIRWDQTQTRNGRAVPLAAALTAVAR